MDSSTDIRQNGGYGVTTGACALTAAGGVFLQPYLDLVNIVMLFLLVVLIAATRYGRGPAVLAALLGVALFDFFLVPPHLSFAVSDAQYLITFAVMLAVALTTAHLAANLRQQARTSARKERQTRLLYELARELAGALTIAQAADAVQRFLRDLGLEAALMLPDDNDVLHVLPLSEGAMVHVDMNLAGTAYRQNEQVTLDRLEVFGEASAYFPLKAPMRVRGVLAVHATTDSLSGLPEHRTLLMTAASLTAIALERLHYVDVAQSTQLEIQSERLRSSILSALSHDIRTPLTALVGLADSLTLTAPPLPASAHETAAAIAEQAGQLHRLVENLLDMARLNAGDLRLRKEWCLIEDVIGSSLKLLHHTLEPYDIRIELPATLPLVEFDAVLIERVLGNLLENAAKYSPPGSRITLEVSTTAGALEVSVCDTGPGLPAGLKSEDLFRLFVRGEEESAIPGAGLGLAICKTIIEAHGGAIQACNPSGGGACFRFSLPLGAAPELDDEAIVLARREAS
ncbi:two-component system sensor histidine kinase KdpD [Fluviicoccus keumensis]|uniref:histidine kinase n=1 Tax=Fluviicoccus keumensis TaxID=1435465 RepID=A0A4Q7Z3V2_9GAMM|nr:DUF4118 domain-containing protein [Fluviicoccus keumensis]RZU45062.1 two-component system sensor histidine kinase KdpD [Fluviicoccus keumensis]